MLQLILHALGDYLIQNDYMALNKKKKGWHGHIACQIHCITYALPFWYFYGIKVAFGVYLSHFIIDRYHLIEMFLAIRNGLIKKPWTDEAGCRHSIAYQLAHVDNFGYSPERPVLITVWLYIIVDNIFHVLCNYFCITYFS